MLSKARGDQVPAAWTVASSPNADPRNRPGASAATAALCAVSPQPIPSPASTNAGNSRRGWRRAGREPGVPGREQHRPAGQHPHRAVLVPVPPGRHAHQRGGHVVPHVQQHRQLRGSGPAVPGREQVRGPQDQQRGSAVPGLEPATPASSLPERPRSSGRIVTGPAAAPAAWVSRYGGSRIRSPPPAGPGSPTGTSPPGC